MFLKKWPWWLIGGLSSLLIANVYPALLYPLNPFIKVLAQIIRPVTNTLISALSGIGLINPSLSFVLMYSLPGILGVVIVGILIGMLVSLIYIKIKKDPLTVGGGEKEE